MSIDVLREPTARAHGERTESLVAGLVAGQLAGLAMAGFMMLIFAIFVGRNILYPPQVMGALILGPHSLGHLSAALLLGFALHQLGPSFFWSMVFLAVVSSLRARASLADCLAAALFISLIAELVDVYVVMPPFQHALHGWDIWRSEIPRFTDWLSHIVYGLALGLSYGLLRDPIEHRLHPERPPPHKREASDGLIFGR